MAKKFRVHVVNQRLYGYGNGATVRYVIQRRGIFGIWYTVTDEMKDEVYANDICEKYNKYNGSKGDI